MPDGHHSFIELRELWDQGKLTIEECLMQTLYTMVRYESQRNQMHLKIMSIRSAVWEPHTWQTYEELLAQTKADALVDAMQMEDKMSYEVMDFILERGVMLEMKMIQVERKMEEVMDLLDGPSLDLN
jgi:hypothetical protein